MSKDKNNDLIIIHRTDDPFARVPKAVLDDNRLSWKSKGILAYVLGRPPSWRVYVADLVNRSKDGDTAVRTGLKELIEVGYAKRECVREHGVIVGWQLRVADRPMFRRGVEPDSDFPHVGNPHLENPHLENPHVENRTLSKTDYTEMEERESESSRSDVFVRAWEEGFRITMGQNWTLTPETKKFVEKWFQANPEANPLELIYTAVDMWQVSMPLDDRTFFHARVARSSPKRFLTKLDEIRGELGHRRPNFKWNPDVPRVVRAVTTAVSEGS